MAIPSPSTRLSVTGQKLPIVQGFRRPVRNPKKVRRRTKPLRAWRYAQLRAWRLAQRGRRRRAVQEHLGVYQILAVDVVSHAQVRRHVVLYECVFLLVTAVAVYMAHLIQKQTHLTQPVQVLATVGMYVVLAFVSWLVSWAASTPRQLDLAAAAWAGVVTWLLIASWIGLGWLMLVQLPMWIVPSPSDALWLLLVIPLVWAAYLTLVFAVTYRVLRRAFAGYRLAPAVSYLFFFQPLIVAGGIVLILSSNLVPALSP